MKSFCLLSLALIVAFTGAFIGCGGGSSDQPAASGTAVSQSAPSQTAGLRSTNAKQVSHQAANSAQKTAADTGEFQLVGVWLGTSGLDTDALDNKLATLESEAAEALRAKVATFDSMYIAAQYNRDGTVELDMTIQPAGGDALRDQSFGTWQAQQTDSRIAVTTTEKNKENSESTTKYYSIVDADHIALVPPVSEELQDLNPIVLFERIVEQRIPHSADADGNAIETVR